MKQDLVRRTVRGTRGYQHRRIFGNSPRRDLTFVRDFFAQTIEGLGFRTLSLPEHVVFFLSTNLIIRTPTMVNQTGVPTPAF